MNFQKTEGKSDTKLRAASQEERDLQSAIVKFTEAQLDQLARTSGLRSLGATLFERLLEGQLGSVGQFSRTQLDQFEETLSLESQAQADQRELASIQLELIRSGFKPTQEQRDRINEIADQQIRGGTEGIIRGSQRAIDQILESLAPALGLRPGDTPIVERLGDIGEQATSEIAQLVGGAEAQRASSLLNFGPSVAGVTSQIQATNLGTRQFQAQLQQQKFKNQILLGTSGNQILGLSSPVQGLSVLQQPRLAQPRTVTKGIGGDIRTEDIATAVSSIGGGIGGGAGAAALSSARFKRYIQNMGISSELLTKLRPVTFRYREGVVANGDGMQYGLLAEEVAEVAPELVIYDEEGAPYAVRYDVLPSMLLNEMQKQQRVIAELTSRLGKVEQDLAEGG